MRDHIAACVQLRHDSPLGQRHGPLAALSDADLAAYCDEHLGEAALAAAIAPIDRWANELQAPDWELMAEHLNAFLGSSLPAPPWTADQWQTLRVVLELTGD